MKEIDLEKKKIIQESAKKLGSKIQSLRKSKGLSLMQLATKLDVSDTALSKIETAKTTSITIELGKGIASALGVSFNELFEIEVFENKELNIENERLKGRIKELEKVINLYENHIKSFQFAVLEANSEARNIATSDLYKAIRDISDDKKAGEITNIALSYMVKLFDILKRKGYIDEKNEIEYQKNSVGAWLLEDDPEEYFKFFKSYPPKK